MRTVKTLLATAAALAVTTGAALAEKWDMPMAYSASNFHSATGAEFARCVTIGTGGDIEIATHPSGALFAGANIKRAVQTGQVQIGERLLSGHQNENVIFGVDSVPFLATSFDDAATLWKAAKPTMTNILADQNLHLLYSVPWPPQGLYFKKEVNSIADMKGLKFRSYNNATARLAELTGMLPVQIEAAEISQAFATGVAESMISSGSTGRKSISGACDRAATGTFHWKALSWPVVGDTGIHSCETTPSAVHAGSRGALTARASHSRDRPRSPNSPVSSG